MLPSLRWLRRLRDFLSRRSAGIGGGLVSMRLGAGQYLRLHDAAGWTVVCRRGDLWITQEADANDVFLAGGEGFLLDRPGLALLCARRDSVVSMRPPARGKQRVRVIERGCATAEYPDLRDDSSRIAWLRALYPEGGPWNGPDAYRRLGLL